MDVPFAGSAVDVEHERFAGRVGALEAPPVQAVAAVWVFRVEAPHAVSQPCGRIGHGPASAGVEHACRLLVDEPESHIMF